ncbi:hypothetical protein [Virgibacillus kimchii]
MDSLEVPVSFIGTSTDQNEANTNGMAFAAELLGITVPEVVNRAASMEVRRHAGIVKVNIPGTNDIP